MDSIFARVGKQKLVECWKIQLGSSPRSGPPDRLLLGRRVFDPGEVYRQLLASAARTAPGNRKARPNVHDWVVEDEDGLPFFRIGHQQDSIALLLPVDRTSAMTLDAIQRAATIILAASAIQCRPPCEGTYSSW